MIDINDFIYEMKKFLELIKKYDESMDISYGVHYTPLDITFNLKLEKKIG